jgi:hypothetical protein
LVECGAALLNRHELPGSDFGSNMIVSSGCVPVVKVSRE